MWENVAPKYFIGMGCRREVGLLPGLLLLCLVLLLVSRFVCGLLFSPSKGVVKCVSFLNIALSLLIRGEGSNIDSVLKCR